MQSKLTRRAVLAGVPAVAAVAAMPVIPTLAGEHEPLLALWAEYQRAKAEGRAISREYAAAEAKLPRKWQHRWENGEYQGPGAPAFMPDRAEYEAARRRVGLDEIGQRSDNQSDIINECERCVLTTMPVTLAGAAIVAKTLLVALEAGMGSADEIAIENLAAWLERQAGGVS